MAESSNLSWLTEGNRRDARVQFGYAGKRPAVNQRSAMWGHRRALQVRALVDGFMLTINAEGRAPATASWYRARLDRFVTFVHDAPASSISAQNIRSWLLAVKQGTNSRTNRPVSDGYVESHRKAISSMFTWAEREDLIPRSPCVLVRPYRIEIHELPILTVDDVRALIETQPRRTFVGERNRVMLALLYDTGIRVGELIHIEIGDVELAGGTIRVCGKARRDRRVPISATMRSAIWAFCESWRPQALSPRLFTSYEGEALSETSVNQWMRRAARRAGIAGVRVSPHTFRHSFATAYLQNGGDVFTLQKILGHTTMTMVRRYVHMAAGDVAARHAIASPLERLARGGAA